MLTTMLQGVINAIGSFGRFITVLPTSPFQNLESIIGTNPAIDAVLWVVPVGQALSLLQVWCTAILIYYIAKVPLRWAKVVKG
jgi:hypothetical protein